MSANFPDTFPPIYSKQPNPIKIKERLIPISLSLPSILRDPYTIFLKKPEENAKGIPPIIMKNKKGLNFLLPIILNTSFI